MGKCIKFIYLPILYITFVVVMLCSMEKTRILSLERPVLVYYDPKYFSYVNFSSQRYTRANYIYYVSIHFDLIYSIDNNVSTHFYIYEYRGNRYYRSYIELHYKLCDFFHKDQMFGAPMRQGKLAEPCPYPAGDYHLYNMTIQQDAIPRGFPITKGRIWVNLTMTSTQKVILSGFSDMEVRLIENNRVKQKKDKS